MYEAQRVSWEDVCAMLQDSIEGVDDNSMLFLTNYMLSGDWEYDKTTGEFIRSEPGPETAEELAKVMRKYTKAELDKIDGAELLSRDDIVFIDGFDKDAWKSIWLQAVEGWWEDGGAWHDYIMNGFKGWAARTTFEVYCDLRFTFIDGQDMTWDDLWTECQELGKYS